LSAEDGAILEAARRTSDLLGLAGFYPTSVSWQSEIGIGRGTKVVTPHFPELEGSKLIISPILQGRLDSQDWGSILASPLILKGLKGFYNIWSIDQGLTRALVPRRISHLELRVSTPRFFSHFRLHSCRRHPVSSRSLQYHPFRKETCPGG